VDKDISLKELRNINKYMKNMEPEYDLDLSFGFEHMDQEYQKEMFELDKNEINDNVEYFNQSVVDDHSLTIE